MSEEPDSGLRGELVDGVSESKLVNFEIDVDLWRRLKSRCALKRRTMKSVLEQLIREYLDRNLEV